MMEPNSASADQFFAYYLRMPCGRVFRRVAFLGELTVVNDLEAILGCVTELYDAEQYTGIVQSYMTGTISAEFDASGELIDAFIELERGSKTEGCLPLFDARPATATIVGA